ncbi:pentatricopeptide repeat-containing protein [Tanacetum coccineum]|uniref:Pentatricopeptide repeat-containing protein n=1 Tax=Tanacetum coccineum TaxID=301880 RepID=A0ABQ5E4S4_9ASTR
MNHKTSYDANQSSSGLRLVNSKTIGEHLSFTIFKITALDSSRAGPTKKEESRLARSLHSLILLADKDSSLEVERAARDKATSVMTKDARNMSYVELISLVEEEEGKSPVKEKVDNGESLLKKTMDKGKSKVLVDDIPVKKHVCRNNGIVIEENVNPFDTDSDSESEDELIELRKRKTEAKKAPKKSNRQTLPVNEGTSTSISRQRVYGVGDSETLMEHEEFMDDLMKKLRDEGDAITDPFKIVESKSEKYPIHDVETHWRMRKPKSGEKFMDVDQLKECLTYYALANVFSLHAKRWALSEGETAIEDHYAYIRSYGKAILESNHGSTVKVGVTVNPDSKTYFDRFYVCFKGLKEGWKLGCRNVIALDVAWAVVNVENKYNWSWFLDLLGDDLDMPTGNGLTIISYQHKVLIQAVKDIMPHAEHRQCARHVYEGFRKQFSGVEFKSLFWAASKASYPGLFNKIMDKIKRANPKAYQYLLDKDPKTWSRAYFHIGINCEVLLVVENGFSECFNSVLLRVRNKPLITMLEAMRVIVPERMNTMRKLLESWNEDIRPNIQKRLEVTKDQHRFWHVIPTSVNLFEVRNGSKAFRVDEEHRTCSCRLWQLSGHNKNGCKNPTVVLPPKPPTKKGRPRKQVGVSSLLDEDLVYAPVDSARVDVIAQNIQNAPNAETAATQSS